MGINFSLKLVLVALLIFVELSVLLLSGCRHLQIDNNYNKLDDALNTIRFIEPLELEEDERLEEVEKDEIISLNTDNFELSELELSIEECRALALENNLDLKVQLINPTISAERVNQEEAKFEAVFSSKMLYEKTDTPVATTLEIQGSSREVISADLGVSLPLKTGGEINIDLTDNRYKTNSIWTVFNPTYDPDFSASISQSLLRNAGKRVNEYAIRIAEYDWRISETQTKLQVINLITKVDQAYWKLYAYKEILDVRNKQYEMAKVFYKETQELVKLGAKAEVELIRAEAGTAEILEAIITAKNYLQDAERDLKQLLNKTDLGMETSTALIPSTEPDPVHFELQRKEMVAKAIENRMEMIELELQIAQDSSTIDYLENQTLPLVDMEYKYNINGHGASRTDSYHILGHHKFDDHRIELNVSIPLGNNYAQSRLHQAEYQRAQRLASRDSKEALIKQEVLQQVDKLEANWQKILARRKVTIIRNQQYQSEKRQFELGGMVTSSDVLNAQTDLTESQISEITALAEYQIALVDLSYATGTLLGATKVRWEPFIPEH